MKHRNIQFDKATYLQLSELGSRFKLSFSSHLILGNRIIGLDGRKKKLLVLEINSVHDKSFLIDLDKVKTISVKKSYSGITPGKLNKRKIEKFLKTILLQFEYKDEAETTIVPFYENGIDNSREIYRFEKNARNWQMLLSKMIGSQIDEVTMEKRSPLAV